jgi:hypothetical protein
MGNKPHKLSDLDEDRYERVQDELSAMANVHGHGMWDKPGAIMSENIEDIYGICATCTYFFYNRREFGEPLAACRYLLSEDGGPVRLHAKARMVECKGHSKRAHLTLAQMMDIAWIIETPKRVGFVP